MTLLYMDSFETTKAEISPTPTYSTSTFRTGVRGLQGGTGSSAAPVAIPASAKITVGVAINALSTQFGWVSLSGDSGATQHLTVRVDPSNGGIVTLRLGLTTGTVLATGTGPAWPGNEWHHLQIQATIADSGGRCIVKQDGVTVIDYTGDTKNAGTSTNIDRVNLGANSSSAWFDDLWICDGVDATATQGRPNNDFLGDLRVSALVPTGAGTVTQLTPTVAPNWDCVNEIPSNTTDYVSSATVGQRDLYATADLPANTQTVYAVQVGGACQKSDAGAASVKYGIKESGGSESFSGALPLSTTFGNVHGPIVPVKPSGGVWTASDVNGAQIGVEVA